MGMANIIPIRLNDANAIRIVRSLAAKSSDVYLLQHARERMRQRGITLKQVLSCLRSGFISECAHVDIKGDWRFTMRHIIAGDDINVAVALKQKAEGKMVAVITVF